MIKWNDEKDQTFSIPFLSLAHNFYVETSTQVCLNGGLEEKTEGKKKGKSIFFYFVLKDEIDKHMKEKCVNKISFLPIVSIVFVSFILLCFESKHTLKASSFSSCLKSSSKPHVQCLVG